VAVKTSFRSANADDADMSSHHDIPDALTPTTSPPTANAPRAERQRTATLPAASFPHRHPPAPVRHALDRRAYVGTMAPALCWRYTLDRLTTISASGYIGT